MKRAHDDVDDDCVKKRDGSPSGLRSRINDGENEFSRKSNCQEKNLKKNEKQNILQNNETFEPHDSVITQFSTVDDNIDAPKPNGGYYDAPRDKIKLYEKVLSNMEKSSENKRELLELEAISSDDDIGIAMDSEEEGALESDLSDSFNEDTDDIAKDFIPSQFQATPLRSIQDPSLSLFGFIHRKLGDDSKCEEVAELIECLELIQSKNVGIDEKWVSTAERIVEILPKTLCHILNIPDYCHKLFSLINVALDFTCALKEHISVSTTIIRHLKIGFQLIEAICQYNEDLSEHLIKHHQIHNKLINLFFVEHMSLSLKLYILRALDSSLNGSEPIRLFLYPGVFDNLTGYDTLLKILSTQQRPRICFLVNSILRKIHFYELLQKQISDPVTLDSNNELLLHERLAEITTTYVKAPILMGCPKRFLQARAQFELTPELTHSDVYPTIYRLFDDSSLISYVTKLLDKPNAKDLFGQHVLHLLRSIMDCDHGLRYLGCRSEELNKLINVLNKVDDQFKVTLVYKIKVLTIVDYLSYFWECNLIQNFKLDQIESVDILHDLFSLTLTTNGKYSVANVLTMGDNLEVILNFFKYMEQSRSKEDDLHIMYSIDLMKIVLENAEDVSYLKKYGTLMYELLCKYNCFNNLVDWMVPAMKHSTFFHDDVSELCNIVKNNINNCSNFNKTLVTSLRILKYLGVPNDETAFEGVEDFIELKYKYIILQMYSCDMLCNLLSIIDKMCDSYKQPALNIWKLTGNKAKSAISIIRPSIVLIRCMMTLLIQSRKNEFKDLSPIKILLKLYSLMHYVPDCSTVREDATKVAKDVVKTLKTYIEIKSGSLMINEVIVWTLSCPSVFVPGLLLLCKLLPSTLPIQTVKPLEESVLTTMISFRTMWINHLTKVKSDLVELITVLGSSTLFSQLFKYLCIMIADLSKDMCLFIAQTLLDALMNADNICFNGLLYLLTQLCDDKEHTAVKTAIIHLLNEAKSPKKYEKFVQKICENITNDALEVSFLFVQCLCDSNTILLTGSCTEEILPKYSVPNSWFLNNIFNILLNLLGSCKQFSTLSLVIKTCTVMIKNDYGFYQFKTVLDTFSKPFNNIFENLLQNWNKKDIHCVNTLLFTVQLLSLCAKNDGYTKRILFLNTSQLKEYLIGSNDDTAHPIWLLKQKVQEQHSVCHQSLVDLVELITNDQKSETELIEPQLAEVDFLSRAFKDRLFYVISSNNKNYPKPETELYSFASNNLLECNIDGIISDLPEFNIKEKIIDLFKIDDCVVQPQLVHKQEPVVTEKKENSANVPVITATPVRNKVFSRLGVIQRPDTFRNRVPNTSRPPSLHVDDFVAMETRSIRQPSRYSLPIQPIRDLNLRLRERQMAYERTYSLFSPYKSHLSLHNWHAQVNALAHLRADYRQTISSRHLEHQRHSLIAEWRQIRIEAALRNNRAYSRR